MCVLLFFIIGIQIILESFPVSSSGHVFLFEHLCVLCSLDSAVLVSHNKVVSHFLHGPTVCVLAIFFFDRWSLFLLHIKRCWNIILKLVFFVFVADGITALFFLFFNKVLPGIRFSLGFGFLCSAIALFSLYFCNKTKYEPLTLRKVLLLGMVQGFSLLPGISRFALTFTLACWLNVKPQKAFEFSFAMQWPLIAAGFFNSLIVMYVHCMPVMQFMYKDSGVSEINFFGIPMLAVLFFSSIVAFLSLRWVKLLIDEGRLWYFSFYLFFVCILSFSFL